MKQKQTKNSRRINNVTSVVKWNKTVYKRENMEVQKQILFIDTKTAT